MNGPASCGDNCVCVSMEDDSPWTLFFCVSRIRVVSHASRKVWSGVSPRTTPYVLWNYISRKQNYMVRRWDVVLVYPHKQRQKKSPIWIRFVVYLDFCDESACAPMLMISPIGVAFFVFLRQDNIGVAPGHLQETLVEVFRSGARGFLEVKETLQ